MREDSGNNSFDPYLAPGQPLPSSNGPPLPDEERRTANLQEGRTSVATPPAKDNKPPEQKDAFREIVETVVFVVVLVLLLKAFMAEAFVIPTGSMATTLLGYHREITCPQCGMRFPLNMSKQYDAQETAPEPVTGCTCPNCDLHINGNNSEEFRSR